MIIESPFKPAWWLANPHVQTVYPTFAQSVTPPDYRLERLELPDNDFIDLAWAEASLPKDAPLVILLHGLGGGIHSSYVPRLLNAFNAQGWRGVLMHFRGSGAEPNRLPRVYHSGDTDDLNYLLELLAKQKPATKKALVGISLGGNVLLKWLGEHPKQSIVEAGVAVSVPFQLRLAADRMNQGLSRLYRSYLLKEMRTVFSHKLTLKDCELPPGLHNMDAYHCFWTFDEYVTAPLHGFSSVHDYYRESSCKKYLPTIETKALIIHALDDPFMMSEAVPLPDEMSSAVTIELSKKGGHVGFVSGQIPGMPECWLDQRIPEFLKIFLA
jgi:uncharacterized protein